MDNGGFDVDPDPEETSRHSKSRSAVPRRRVVSTSSPSRHSWASSPPPQNTSGSSAPPSPMGRCEPSPVPSPEPSPPSPDVSPVRYNPVPRSHALKYSGGALHGPADAPLSFDHNFDSPLPLRRSLHGVQVSSPQNSPTPPRRPHRTLPRSPCRLKDNEGTPESPSSVRKSRSLRPLPPLVRVQQEDGSRGSSLSRDIEHRGESARASSEAPSLETISLSSHSSLQVSSPTPVAKSASMSLISTASDPVSEARKRSYLVGSVGPTSLLGTQELERQLPNRTIRIFVGTWNMNGQVPPRHLAEFLLPADLQHVPDLLVIGTQETFPEKTEWEVRLQDTLGPSHVLFHSASLGTLHLTVFLRRDLIWYCSIPEDDSFSTRPGAQFKTKGAVAVSFLLFGTSFIFVNSHLTAHTENVKDRVKDLKKIYAMLNLPKLLPLKRKHDIFDSYDCVFWCGDLNFRLEQTRAEIIRDIDEGVSVMETDQLGWLMQKGTVFRGFKEHLITFKPTYKYDPGTDNFDTSSKQRIPSYTDRILFKHSSSSPVRPLHYDSVQGVTTSDHKPVWGMFEVRVKPGKDSVPLAGGLFNRAVYLEGLKRRSESLKPHLGRGHTAAHICHVS